MVLAAGLRLGPSRTSPKHGIDYWPQSANIVQASEVGKDYGCYGWNSGQVPISELRIQC